MLVDYRRQKLVNTIVFFARNTNHCGKTKLIKLLYLFDVAHYRETGLSATGLEYRAWKMGPVPLALYQEWDALEADLAAAIDIVPVPVFDYDREQVRAKAEFDPERFTKRELKILNELAARYRDEYSIPLVELTHREGGAWAKIWDSGRGDNDRIPYALSIPDNDPHREALLATDAEYVSRQMAIAR